MDNAQFRSKGLVVIYCWATGDLANSSIKYQELVMTTLETCAHTRQLQQAAVVISVLSVLYNGGDRGVSIGFGMDASSTSLPFFGIVEIRSEVMRVCANLFF